MDSAKLLAIIAVAFPLSFLAIWSGVVFLVSRLSGWGRLAQHFARDEEPGGQKFTWQTGMVGMMSYRSTLNITVTPSGLFLAVIWPFRLGHPSLFIPRGAIHDLQPRQVLWLKSTRFAVGKPVLAHLSLPTHVMDCLEGSARVR